MSEDALEGSSKKKKLSRRDFLRFSAVAAAGAVIGTTALEKTASGIKWGLEVAESLSERESLAELNQVLASLGKAKGNCQQFMEEHKDFPPVADVFPHKAFSKPEMISFRGAIFPPANDYKVLSGLHERVSHALLDKGLISSLKRPTVVLAAVDEIKKSVEEELIAPEEDTSLNQVLATWLGEDYPLDLKEEWAEVEFLTREERKLVKKAVEEIKQRVPLTSDLLIKGGIGFEFDLRELEVRFNPGIFLAGKEKEGRLLGSLYFAHELIHNLDLLSNERNLASLVGTDNLGRLSRLRWNATAHSAKEFLASDPVKLWTGGAILAELVENADQPLDSSSLLSKTFEYPAYRFFQGFYGNPLANKTKDSMPESGDYSVESLERTPLPWDSLLRYARHHHFQDISRVLEDDRFADKFSDEMRWSGVLTFYSLKILAERYEDDMPLSMEVKDTVGIFLNRYLRENLAEICATYVCLGLDDVPKPSNWRELRVEMEELPQVKYFNAMKEALGAKGVASVTNETVGSVAQDQKIKGSSLRRLKKTARRLERSLEAA
jgi:hypothetical protein